MHASTGSGRRRLLAGLMTAAVVVGFVLLAPSTLGGSATWVSTSGDSMQPTIHAGDLVIARPQGAYQVGDMVAYRSDTLDGTVVLHRIVADTPDGFTTRGDNNDWLDPDQPQVSEILGRLWLHIPGGGRVLAVFTHPLVIAALVLTLLTAGALFTAGRSRRRGLRRTSGTLAQRFRPTADDWPAHHWAAGTALAAVALAFLAFGRPVDIASTDDIESDHTAILSYSASVDAAGVYAGDRVRTGDPVFVSVAPVLDMQLDYRLDSPDTDNVSGTVRTTAKLSTSNGWNRTVPLAAREEFRGNHVEQTNRLDLTALLDLVQRAEKQAGTTFGGYTVRVVHDIRVQGDVDGHTVDTTYRPELTFALDAGQALLQETSGLDQEADTVTLRRDAQIAVPSTTAATITVLRWGVPVSMLRTLALALAAASLLLGALALRQRTAAQQPHAAFGTRLVHASNVELGNRPVVDINDPDALLRLATLYDTAVLYLARPNQHLYLVAADNTVYRYAEPTTDQAEQTPDRPQAAARHSHT